MNKFYFRPTSFIFVFFLFIPVLSAKTSIPFELKTAPPSKLVYEQIDVPKYPELARKKGWEGTAVVKVLVSENGLPAQVYLEKSSGHETLDESALKAVKNWKFNPARFENNAYASLILVPVRFVLSDHAESLS